MSMNTLDDTNVYRPHVTLSEADFITYYREEQTANRRQNNNPVGSSSDFGTADRTSAFSTPQNALKRKEPLVCPLSSWPTNS
jgi:hypothetical protein